MVKLFDFFSVIGKKNISVVLICIYFMCDNEKLSCIYGPYIYLAFVNCLHFERTSDVDEIGA